MRDLRFGRKARRRRRLVERSIAVVADRVVHRMGNATEEDRDSVHLLLVCILSRSDDSLSQGDQAYLSLRIRALSLVVVCSVRRLLLIPLLRRRLIVALLGRRLVVSSSSSSVIVVACHDFWLLEWGIMMIETVVEDKWRSGLRFCLWWWRRGRGSG